MSIRLKLLDDRILVCPDDEKEISAGGIVIPKTASKEDPSRGKVVSVGPGKKGEDGKPVPLMLKAGNAVLFNKYGGTKVEMEGKDYLIMREEDVLGIFEEG